MWGMDNRGGVRGYLGSTALLLTLAVQAGAQGPVAECQDVHDRPVPIQTDKHLAYPAFATRDPDGPRIYWNPKSANGRSDAWRRFVLLHECGHVVLHHIDRAATTLEERRRDELEADCYAILALGSARGTSGSEMAKLLMELGRSAGDAIHLGGEELIQSLEDCQRASGDGRRWRESLDRLLSASADSFRPITGARLGMSWSGAIHEASLDLPGTYDCEIRPPRSFVCLLATAQDERSAHKRFREFKRLVVGWLPADWTSTERPTITTSQPEVFLAQSSSDGTLLALVRTSARRVYFVARPAGPY